MFDLVVQDIRDDVFARNPEYEQLRELGRQIMHADPSKSAQIQSQLAQVRQITSVGNKNTKDSKELRYRKEFIAVASCFYFYTKYL